MGHFSFIDESFIGKWFAIGKPFKKLLEIFEFYPFLKLKKTFGDGFLSSFEIEKNFWRFFGRGKAIFRKSNTKIPKLHPLQSVENFVRCGETKKDAGAKAKV